MAFPRYGTAGATQNGHLPRTDAAVARVRRALAAPAGSTLPGRAVLALDAWLTAERHWQRVQPRSRAWQRLRAYQAARNARVFVPRLLGEPGLASAGWTGFADGSASVLVDGLGLWYARGQVFLAAECPRGGDVHLARVHSLVELGELVASATVDLPSPPWSCTALCPQPERQPAPAAVGRVVFVAGSRTPTQGGLLATRFVTDRFERARDVLVGMLDGHTRMAFDAGQFEQARELAAAADTVPSAPPAEGCWQVSTSVGACYWLHTSGPDPDVPGGVADGALGRNRDGVR